MVYAIDIQDKFAPAKNFGTVGSLVDIALPLAMAGAGLMFLVMALMSAFRILTHGDNPDVLKKAYSSITFAVIGLIIVIASFLAVRVIGTLIGAGDLIPQ